MSIHCGRVIGNIDVIMNVNPLHGGRLVGKRGQKGEGANKARKYPIFDTHVNVARISVKVKRISY